MFLRCFLGDLKRIPNKLVSYKESDSTSTDPHKEVVWMKTFNACLLVAYSDGSLLMWEVLYKTADVGYTRFYSSVWAPTRAFRRVSTLKMSGVKSVISNSTIEADTGIYKGPNMIAKAAEIEARPPPDPKPSRKSPWQVRVNSEGKLYFAEPKSLEDNALSSALLPVSSMALVPSARFTSASIIDARVEAKRDQFTPTYVIVSSFLSVAKKVLIGMMLLVCMHHNLFYFALYCLLYFALYLHMYA